MLVFDQPLLSGKDANMATTLLFNEMNYLYMVKRTTELIKMRSAKKLSQLGCNKVRVETNNNVTEYCR